MSFNPSPSCRASDAPSDPSKVENPDHLSLSWLPVYMEATEKPVFAHGFKTMLTKFSPISYFNASFYFIACVRVLCNK